MTSFLKSTILIGVVAFFLAGCNGSSGPQRFDLRGSVRYKGEPIPKGMIRFIPDGAQGNSGPGAVADIEGGLYKTASGRGVISGPHIVQITGFDGINKPDAPHPDGTPLFPSHSTQVVVEKKSSVVDFEVPVAKTR